MKVKSLFTGVASGVPKRAAGGCGQDGRNRGRHLLRAHHAQETNRFIKHIAELSLNGRFLGQGRRP